MTEYLRLSGIYWALSAASLIDALEIYEKDAIVNFVLECYHECGGFGSSPNHDPHLLYLC